MSSGGEAKTQERAIQDGIGIDYTKLRTQEVIDLVSHYISNHIIKFFVSVCDSPTMLQSTYPLSYEFFESRYTSDNF